MEYILIEESKFKNEPSDDDNLLLDKYFKTKISEDQEIMLNEIEMSQKKELWSLAKMETMVSNDETLSNRYEEMAVDGPFKFGYHWNEVIMNLLFNEFVLEDPRYLEKYLNTIAKEKKTRGNPDRKIGTDNFKSTSKKNDDKGDKKPKQEFKPKYEPKQETKPEPKKKIKENNMEEFMKVSDVNNEDYELITNSQDVQAIRNDIGADESNDYETLFVKYGDGEYVEIYGMEGSVPALSNTIHRIYPKNLDETTASAGNSGQYSGPFMWAKNKENMAFGKKPAYNGGTIVENKNVNFEYFENKLNDLVNEDKKTSSIINKERIGKENVSNFNQHIKDSNIDKIIKDSKSEEPDQKHKSLQDIEDEQVKNMKKEFKPVKHEATDEFKKQVALKRGYGMQDLKYDIEPSDSFKERAKEDMGEELYNLGQEKIELEKGIPMYNKDTTPTKDEDKYRKDLKESNMVTATYNLMGNTKYIDFDISEIEINESITDESFVRLVTEGLGNIYSNTGVLNEKIEKDLNSYIYYLNLNNDEIVKVLKNINESSIDLSSFKKLSNYSPYRKSRGL